MTVKKQKQKKQKKKNQNKTKQNKTCKQLWKGPMSLLKKQLPINK